MYLVKPRWVGWLFQSFLLRLQIRAVEGGEKF